MCSITAGLLGAAGLFGYRQQVQQAENESKALNAQAEAYEQNAKIEGRKQEQLSDNYAKEARDLRNRQRLAQGAQRAQAGSAGIGFSGSQQDLLSSSLKAYGEDQQTLLTNQRNDNYNSRVTQTNYSNAANQKRTEAGNVVESAKGQLLPTILSTAASIVGVNAPTAAASASVSTAAPTEGPWSAVQKTNNIASGPSAGPWNKKSKKNWW